MIKPAFRVFKSSRSKILLIVGLACVVSIAVILLSSAFILIQANHTHDHDGVGGDCATCAHIITAESLLKTLGAAPIGALIVFGSCYAAISRSKPVVAEPGFLTPVSLKIRLNN